MQLKMQNELIQSIVGGTSAFSVPPETQYRSNDMPYQGHQMGQEDPFRKKRGRPRKYDVITGRKLNT